ncbi:hypothetical protein ABTX35_18975 [Streptomyces sp. NPDC096080]|uniref:hypothetical protein n=1 Tax=Streptomyces sp. NPDC096080 TaxID=3156693 RepID=UPI00332C0464
MTETRWNGDPCTARRRRAVVTDNTAFPAYWARHLTGTLRDVVEVTYAGHTFYLDDEDGSAWRKVTTGGSPQTEHRTITIDPCTIQARPAPDPTHPLQDRLAAALKTACSSGHGQEAGFDAEKASATALAVLEEYLDIDDAEAWCKACLRAWGGPEHRCDGDAEQRLAALRESLVAPRPGIDDAARLDLVRQLDATPPSSTPLTPDARVVALYERWIAAGAPPLGVSMARWWDARLAELHTAITPLPPDEDNPDGRRHTMRLLAARATHSLTPEDSHLLRTLIDAEIRDVEAARTETAHWLAFIDRGMNNHIRFSLRNPDGSTEQLPCADWCYACHLSRAEAERDAAYRERAQLLAWLAALHPANAVRTPALDVEDQEGWQLLYLTAGGRQMSWHIHPRDADLVQHVTPVNADDERAQWDGHDTEEKYERMRGHVRLLALGEGEDVVRDA